MLMLPKPRDDRERFTVPVPLYGDAAILRLPRDMTHDEAAKIARVVLAMARCTSMHAGRR